MSIASANVKREGNFNARSILTFLCCFFFILCHCWIYSLSAGAFCLLATATSWCFGIQRVGVAAAQQIHHKVVGNYVRQKPPSPTLVRTH